MNEKRSISELGLLTESEQLIRCRERLMEWHASPEGNYDWRKVLDDKWAIAKITQTKGN